MPLENFHTSANAVRENLVSEDVPGRVWWSFLASIATVTIAINACHRKKASIVGDIHASTASAPTDPAVAITALAPFSHTCSCEALQGSGGISLRRSAVK